eukprot:jgi/Psemu1/9606/gm1.9606_g
MKCNGLNVKWCEGATAWGHMMRRVSIFSALSDNEMPGKPFIVVEVPVPQDVAARVWVDSDMSQMSRRSQLATIESLFKKGMYYNKIGAKTTNCFQPMDIGPFFKDDSTQGDEKAQDVPSSSSCPEVKAKVSSKKNLTDAFVDSGFVSAIDGCPDVNAVMKSKNINFITAFSLEDLFFDTLLQCTAEMNSKGNISEEFYNALGYPQDQDCKGNIWNLTSTSLVFGRAYPIITEDVLKRRTDQAVKNLEDARNARLSKLQEANALFIQADRCSELIFETICSR